MVSPDEKGFGVAVHFTDYSAGFGLYVDPATGKRFVNETANRKVRADAIFALKHPALCVPTEKNARKHTPRRGAQERVGEVLPQSRRPLQDLRDAGGSFQAAARRLERMHPQEVRPTLGAKIFDDAEENDKAPYLVARAWPRAHHTMSGLLINTDAQVQNAYGQPIKGLWAAGEATGGVHGEVRLGTATIADCVVFGRIAGKSAARDAVKL